jgi:hypothetical protein
MMRGSHQGYLYQRKSYQSCLLACVREVRVAGGVGARQRRKRLKVAKVEAGKTRVVAPGEPLSEARERTGRWSRRQTCCRGHGRPAACGEERAGQTSCRSSECDSGQLNRRRRNAGQLRVWSSQWSLGEQTSCSVVAVADQVRRQTSCRGRNG